MAPKATKKNRISVNAFEEAVKNNYDGTVKVNWNGLEVEIKKTLSLKEMLGFVSNVVGNCFSEKEAAYMPEAKDFAIKCFILEYYTNVSLPTNVDNKYDLVYHSSLADEVLEYIDRGQFDAMISAAEEKMRHMSRTSVEATTKEINEIFAAFESIKGQLEETFSGISKDDIAGVLKAVSGGIDEEKIVHAIVNKTDDQKDDE